MQPFSLSHLHDPGELASLGDFDQSRFIAGGTNLVDLMKHQVETPVKLVDLSPWQAARNITLKPDSVEVGAMATNTALANFAYQHAELSVLSQALLSGATVQLRNRATTGGNLLQRTRCYYFYDPQQPCNKRTPGTGCAALDGMNRIHAILGTSAQCIASHPSDMAVAMVALDAKVKTCNASGTERHIPVRDLYRLPGDTPHIETVLAGDELITAVSIPRQAHGTHIYRKVRDRSSYAFALVSVACTLTLEDGVISAVNIALGGVGTRPWHADQAEAFLRGKTVSRRLFEDASELVVANAQGAGGNDFKIPLVVRTLTHVLEQAAAHQRAHPGHQGAIYAR